MSFDVESSTTSAIGPDAAVNRLCPVLRYVAMSSTVQLPMPRRLSVVMSGANHPCSS